jgi:hypothetical protein
MQEDTISRWKKKELQDSPSMLPSRLLMNKDKDFELFKDENPEPDHLELFEKEDHSMWKDDGDMKLFKDD